MRTCFFLFVTVFLLEADTAAAQPHGLSYEVAPVGTRVFWDDAAGLSDGFLWGGALGVGFGQTLTLEGTYLVGRNLQTDFAGLADSESILHDALGNLPPRSVDAQRYGGWLRFSLGSGGLAPYLSAGGGILRLDPDGLDASRRLYALAGAGLVLSGARRYAFTVGGQLLAYRYDPADLLTDVDLAAARLEPTDLSTQTTYNPSVRAALSVYLGGRPHGQRTAFDRSLRHAFRRGAHTFLSPFYGEIAFADGLAFPDRQALAGVRGGVRIGPYAEVSGLYARGTEDDDLLDTTFPSAFSNVQLYGGELGLRLETMLGRGLVPYLSIGGGYLDVLGGYEGRLGTRPEDRFFGLGGGGLEVPLVGPFGLKGDVRALLMSGSDLEDVQTTSDLQTSLLYSVGLTAALGRERRPPTAQRPETVSPSVRAETPASEPPSPINERRESAPEDAPARSNVTDKTITLPVPENGELYVHFGPADSSLMRPGGRRRAAPATNEDVQAIVGETVREVMADEASNPLTQEQVRRITRDVMLDQLQDAGDGERSALREQILMQRIERLEDRLDERPSRSLLSEDDDTLPLADEEAEPEGPRLLGQPLVAAWPYTGLRFGEGPTQIALGVRGDYRARNGWFRLLPEAALGFGSGTSITALLNAAVPVPYARRYAEPYVPYLGLGLGLVSDEGLVGLEPGLNLLVGAEYPFSYGVAFAEVNTFGLFDTTRIMAGYRLSF